MYRFLFLVTTLLACANAASINIRDNQTALPCDTTKCKLPDCLCSSLTPPNGGTGQQNPQIVMLTFDDAVNSVNYDQYQKLFQDRVNPNTCDIGATFFVTHAYNEYDKSHHLWAQGHEIALNSVTHQVPQQYWESLNNSGYKQEMDEMRTMLNHYGFIPKDNMTGFRSPFLQTSGDPYFQALEDLKLGWDCSMPSRNNVTPPLFPYTLDYKSTQDCQIPPCPTDSFPGEWVVPMVDFMDYLNVPCSMVDACETKNTSDSVFSLLMDNFNNHYQSNRAPFGVFLHSKWLEENLFPQNLDGYTRFLDSLADLPDVYIISVSDALAWMKEPTTLDDIENFKPWKCKSRTNLCTQSYNHIYHAPNPLNISEVNFHSCIPCPANYPWLGNPYGN